MTNPSMSEALGKADKGTDLPERERSTWAWAGEGGPTGLGRSLGQSRLPRLSLSLRKF